ncbi:MAG: hypothetical protein WD894_26750 [Pirellulales bacterium]
MTSTESTPLEPLPTPPPRRRWTRFSLRTLLILITVLSVWLGVKVDQARRQKRAVDTLRALGAEIAYEHQRVTNGGFDTRIELDVPAWARELCGDDFFQTCTGVYFWWRLSEDRTETYPHKLTDDDLKCLADLPQLEVLYIDKAPITDAGLAHLPHPKRLSHVRLDDTNAGDDFVKRLKGTQRLVALGLDNTRVSDAGLAELRGIKTLTSLSLVGTQTGDQGLAAFSACRQLEALRPGSKVTNEGLRQFETLENIEFLLAADCQITGEALDGIRLPKADEVHLRRCAIADDDLEPLVQAVRDVRVLNLHECRVGDAGLHHLADLGKTEILILSKTSVQGRELRHLAALPGIQWLSLHGCPLDNPDLKSLEPLYTGTAPGIHLSLDKTPIGDDDLAKLSGFTTLTHLTLSHTKITDAGLPCLYALKRLAVLDLRETQVTAEGVRQLQQAIRGLMIGSDEDPKPKGWPW